MKLASEDKLIWLVPVIKLRSSNYYLNSLHHCAWGGVVYINSYSYISLGQQLV
jgi:hypothetical protein